ncbi:hypothetical protein DRO97_01385 [Archaeoglobales archaeon]|nr:MAG: hypothetical protein DRO97_01385 [Archaeoglobales archaeon]
MERRDDIIYEIKNIFGDHHLERFTDLKSLIKLKLKLMAYDKESIDFLLENIEYFDKFEREILLEAIFETLTEKLEEEVNEVDVKIDKFSRNFDFIFLSIDFWKKWVGVVVWVLFIVVLIYLVFVR